MTAWIVMLAVIIAVMVGIYIYVKWDNFGDLAIAGGIIGMMFILTGALSWIITVGIIKLITMCFGWTFSWGIATGVWLIIFLLKSIFNVTVKK